jgi:hypothetical protein
MLHCILTPENFFVKNGFHGKIYSLVQVSVSYSYREEHVGVG